MNRITLKNICQMMLLGVCWLLTACAATELHLKPSYQPVGESKGKNGVVLLASSLDGVRAEDARIQWVFGEIRDSDGKVKGNITSSSSPATVLRDALQLELLRAGYQVQLVTVLPAGTERGLVLSAATLQLDETVTLVKSEAVSRVGLSVEVWKKGAKTNTLSFESRFSDFALKDREKLHTTVMQKALGSAFSKAVPALVEQLDKESK